jgi:hypothetical protein
MIFLKNLKIILISSFLLINSCGGKLPGADARKYPADPAKRVENNLKEGRGFRLKDVGNNRGGTFEFASSNELWRASLDTIDFMPLVSANYSGGIIITDWYSENENEAIKITLRFLSNEIRSDSVDIKIFLKKCDVNENCKISESTGNLNKELKKQILKKAALYEKEKNEKKD